jgi:Zn-dependent peptidase ImmA (M78 family)
MSRTSNAIPAKPEVLRWAREVRGYSPRQAATRLGLAERDLVAIEKGDQPLTGSLLQKMIVAYRQVESVLLLPYPPETDPLPTDFRTATRRRKGLSPETLLAIRDARRIQHYVTELVELDRELMRHADIPHYSVSDDVARAAADERRRFQVTLEMQKAWRPGDDTYHRWRHHVQEQGILVIFKSMPWDDCRGMSLWTEDLLPAIVVNSQDAPNGRVFTLFHEYAHLTLRSPGICTHDDAEGWTNAFAAQFLVPSAALLESVAGSRRFSALSSQDWMMKDVRRIAAEFRVSAIAMARRLKELEVTDFYDHNKEELRLCDKARRSEPPPDAKRPRGWKITQKVAEVGSAAATAVLEALREEIIDPIEAADILDLSLAELPEFEERAEVSQRRERGL